MSFRRKIQYFLVQKLRISNREAKSNLLAGLVLVNNTVTMDNIEIYPEDEIQFQNKIIKPSQKFTYLKFYKPVGIECTLNPDIPDNLSQILPFSDVFPVGRLDKASEGLLILTNDGRIYDKILRKEKDVEKEYIVKTDHLITLDFVEKMAAGILIMGKNTLPCKIVAIDDFSFNIILTQGLNRQIRRMCYKLGYEVVFLKRIRIGNIVLGDLKDGQFEEINNPIY